MKIKIQIQATDCEPFRCSRCGEKFLDITIAKNAINEHCYAVCDSCGLSQWWELPQVAREKIRETVNETLEVFNLKEPGNKRSDKKV